MLDYSTLSLSSENIEELSKLNINYVFQPIFKNDGKTVYAFEALMRPVGRTVTELIYEYMDEGKLHILELATFFGSVNAYIERGYTEYIAINSFPSESFTDDEREAFFEYFPEMETKGIVEILEYPKISLEDWDAKVSHIKHQKLQIAVDDFGTGNHNSMDVINLYRPHIVKLDRTMISNIDSSYEKQANFCFLRDKFHKDNMLILAEGVETEDECIYLKENGADLLQGYFLGMPK